MKNEKSLYDLFLDRRGLNEELIAQLNASEHAQLKSIDEMADALHYIKTNNLKIVVLPDFDTDGIMSGTVGFAGLSAMGFNVGLYRPDATRGYGFDIEDVDQLLEEFSDAKAVITCDVGITCYEGVAAFKERGLYVLVTDHHVQPQSEQKLIADVIVDPNRVDETYANKGICGAYVMWQVLHHYAQKYGNEVMQHQIKLLRIFAGIGTVSDMMPLLYENRQLVRDAITISKLLVLSYDEESGMVDESLLYGPCESLHYRRAINGMAQLLRKLEIAKKIKSAEEIDEDLFGFYIAPMFNAVKRMGESMDFAFGLFFSHDASQYADKLFELNEARKEMVSRQFETMMEDEQLYTPYIYVSEAPVGVLGLLANKLIMSLGHPLFVFQKQSDGSYHGSGRSPVWYPALDRIGAENFYIAGHQGAFGIRVGNDKELERLYNFIKEDVAEQKAIAIVNGTFVQQKADITLGWGVWNEKIDGELDAQEMFDFLELVNNLKPFGKEFEKPKMSLFVDTSNYIWQPLGQSGAHIKCVLDNDIELIQWNSARSAEEWQELGEVELVGAFSVNKFFNTTKLNFIIDNVVD